MASCSFEHSTHRRKRVRFESDNSELSNSDDSADTTTSTTANSTLASEFGSDNESELSESSEEPSSASSSEDEQDATASDAELEEDQDEDGIVTLHVNRGLKPNMKLDKDALGPDIRTFLKDFLPQLKAANEELEAQRREGTLKGQEIDAEEDEVEGPYIEMDLGLGVFEGKDSEMHDDFTSDDDTAEKKKSTDVLAKLMRRSIPKESAAIQEVREA